MKKLLLSLLGVVALVLPAHAGTGDTRLPTVNSDGATYGEVQIPFNAGAAIVFGTTQGTYGTVSLSNYVTSSALTTALSSYALASSVPAVRAQPVTMSAAATKTVTFTTPFPTGTSVLVYVSANGLATSGYATNITVTGFTLVLPIVVTGTVSYIATAAQ